MARDAAAGSAILSSTQPLPRPRDVQAGVATNAQQTTVNVQANASPGNVTAPSTHPLKGGARKTGALTSLFSRRGQSPTSQRPRATAAADTTPEARPGHPSPNEQTSTIRYVTIPLPVCGGTTFEWTVDGIRREFTAPDGMMVGQKHEFTFVSGEVQPRGVKARTDKALGIFSNRGRSPLPIRSNGDMKEDTEAVKPRRVRARTDKALGIFSNRGRSPLRVHSGRDVKEGTEASFRAPSQRNPSPTTWRGNSFFSRRGGSPPALRPGPATQSATLNEEDAKLNPHPEGAASTESASPEKLVRPPAPRRLSWAGGGPSPERTSGSPPRLKAGARRLSWTMSKFLGGGQAANFESTADAAAEVAKQLADAQASKQVRSSVIAAIETSYAVKGQSDDFTRDDSIRDDSTRDPEEHASEADGEQSFWIRPERDGGNVDKVLRETDKSPKKTRASLTVGVTAGKPKAAAPAETEPATQTALDQLPTFPKSQSVRDMLLRALLTFEAFARMSPQILDLLIDAFEEHPPVNAGRILVPEDGKMTRFFVVIRGELDIMGTSQAGMAMDNLPLHLGTVRSGCVCNQGSIVLSLTPEQMASKVVVKIAKDDTVVCSLRRKWLRAVTQSEYDFFASLPLSHFLQTLPFVTSPTTVPQRAIDDMVSKSQQHDFQSASAVAVLSASEDLFANPTSFVLIKSGALQLTLRKRRDDADSELLDRVITFNRGDMLGVDAFLALTAGLEHGRMTARLKDKGISLVTLKPGMDDLAPSPLVQRMSQLMRDQV